MINFFRKTRKQLADDNKPIKYLRYAIGEILLVVIGILIALQVNNWNEIRKQDIKRNFYLSSLLGDLNENAAYIQKRNTAIRADLQKLQDIGKRVGSPKATIDTVTKIAREEVSLFYYGFTQLNENTYQTLKSTGHVEYLEPWLQEELQHLNFMHNDLIDVSNSMGADHSQVLIEFLKTYPLNKTGHIISSELADHVLKNLLNSQKISFLNSLLWIKGGAYYSVLRRSEPLEEKTIWLADTLKVIYPFLKNQN